MKYLLVKAVATAIALGSLVSCGVVEVRSSSPRLLSKDEVRSYYSNKPGKPTPTTARPLFASRKASDYEKPVAKKAARRRAAGKKKLVYWFGDGKADGNSELRDLLGGQGANLAEMSRLGLPVPPGLTITTEVCTHYVQNGQRYPRALKKEVEAGLRKLERSMKKRFGDPKNPLLVSVRSGARVQGRLYAAITRKSAGVSSRTRAQSMSPTIAGSERPV